ncbi:hypothetical protein [Halopseudomonas salina]|uniref:Minor tail protein n=1 Tax=Halopseudomonas salina TaxID=1323744 RepID=A0ABQ1NYM7_9GAMM|nr:hypothetical protein [Halopseudomonas salina]GGC87469.1 hypothetical protein GCM10007418_04030 [Halopseudomonas salina]
MLNSLPLNSAPLNSVAVSDSQTITIQPGGSFTWRWAATLAGVDVSATLAGPMRIEAVEDGDRVATFDLWLGPDPVTIADYAGMAVTLDFVVMGDPVLAVRLFTGSLVQPEFDVLTRVLSCTATTRLADTIEAMPIELIDALVAGQWSVDVFEETAGRSRWEYAQERLSTRTASLCAGRDGQPRIVEWYPAGTAYEFAPGSTAYQSLDISLASLSDTTNVVELEMDYRYSRYRERGQSYSWLNPATGGNTSITGFNAWRADSTELPDIQMVTDAVESAGWFITASDWYRLPGDLPELPQPWYNKNIDLLLGADFTTAFRWSQRAVEAYRFRLEVAAAVAAVGEVITRDRVVLDTDTDADALWESSRTNPAAVTGDEPIDQLPRRDQPRLDVAINTALARARSQLLQAQRGNRVSWQVPLGHALDVDIGQGIRLADRATATGVVVGLTAEGDQETGSAMLTITLAVSRGEAEAVADVLAPPDPPEFVDVVAPIINPVLPTQLIKDSSSPPYNEEMPGFAGSYSIGTWPPENRYPRRFAIDAPEIPEQWRDEITAERAVVIRVAPPVDVLEI